VKIHSAVFELFYMHNRCINWVGLLTPQGYERV